MARETKDERDRRDEAESRDGRQVAEREGFGAAVDREDDVEGHSHRHRAPEGIHHRREGEGISGPVIAGDDDDVEGHSYGRSGTRGE
jgi:hypothetical protein